MSDVFPVDPQWAKKQPLRQRQVPGDVRALGARTRTASGPRWPSGSTGSSADPDQEHLVRRATSRIRWFEDGELNVCVNCLDRHLAKRGDQTAIIWEGDDPTIDRQDHLPRAAREGLPLANVLKEHGRQEGRPGHHLPADDPRGRLRHARLRPHRRDPLGGVRRLLARQPGRPHRRLRQQARHHRRRGPARRPAVPLKANADEALEKCAPDVKSAGGPAHRHERADDATAATSMPATLMARRRPTARPSR